MVGRRTGEIRDMSKYILSFSRNKFSGK